MINSYKIIPGVDSILQSIIPVAESSDAPSRELENREIVRWTSGSRFLTLRASFIYKTLAAGDIPARSRALVS